MQLGSHFLTTELTFGTTLHFKCEFKVHCSVLLSKITEKQKMDECIHCIAYYYTSTFKLLSAYICKHNFGLQLSTMQEIQF